MHGGDARSVPSALQALHDDPILEARKQTPRDDLISLMNKCDDAGRTAIEVAVANELGTMARRLQAYCEELQK